MSLHKLTLKFLAWLALLGLLLGGCRQGNPSPASPTETSPLTPSSASPTGSTPSLTPFQPSPTPAPLAASVNGEGISLSQYQAELARYKAALTTDLTPEDEQRVLNELIDQVLLAQGAAENGFQMDDAALQERYDQLVEQAGGQSAFQEWMAVNGYVEETFRLDLKRADAAAWMRDQITASLPATGEQVHARQILLTDAQQAQEALARLQAGTDFAALAAEVDPVTEGELGWFPRGYLLYPQLDEAAFALQPGEYSSVIETAAGFHILQVLEREADRPLEPGARLVLQSKLLQSWLDERHSQSDIQTFVP